MRRSGGRPLPLRVPKPWGHELIWAWTERYVGKILHIRRGEMLSYQYHRRKDETLFCLRGALELEVAGDSGRRRRRLLGPGQSYRVRPGVRHRLRARATSDVLEASTPEVDDVVRLEDVYGRVAVRGRTRRRAR